MLCPTEIGGFTFATLIFAHLLVAWWLSPPTENGLHTSSCRLNVYNKLHPVHSMGQMGRYKYKLQHCMTLGCAVFMSIHPLVQICINKSFEHGCRCFFSNKLYHQRWGPLNVARWHPQPLLKNTDLGNRTIDHHLFYFSTNIKFGHLRMLGSSQFHFNSCWQTHLMLVTYIIWLCKPSKISLNNLKHTPTKDLVCYTYTIIDLRCLAILRHSSPRSHLTLELWSQYWHSVPRQRIRSLGRRSSGRTSWRGYPN